MYPPSKSSFAGDTEHTQAEAHVATSSTFRGPASPMSAFLSLMPHDSSESTREPNYHNNNNNNNHNNRSIVPNNNTNKRYFWSWKDSQQQSCYSQYTIPSKFYPFVAPMVSPYLSTKDIRISSLISSRCSSPIFELFEMSADLPFILDEGANPFVILRLFSRTPNIIVPNLSDPCPLTNLAFSRVAVSKSFCQLVDYTEVLHRPSILFFSFFFFCLLVFL